jgi:acetyl-CoA synthetase
VVGLGNDRPGALDYRRLLARASDAHVLADTSADDPAFLIYTSGTTGHPKGTVHGHRSVMAHAPSVSFWLDGYPRGDELHWTPNDWAWLAGLGDVLLASLYVGQPVLAYRFPKFDPERALDLVRRHGVNVALIPPTALKLMRNACAAGQPPLPSLRAVATGGESLGAEMLDWGRKFFGLTFSEGYGLTEFNFMTGNCARLFEPRAGSCGRPFPGRSIAIVDAEGNVLPAGQEGIIAARHPDPIMMLGYWRNPEATAQRSRQGWFLSGDVGHLDEDGYFWFKARDDDLITSGGYRIGPGEIEECLITHPAVALAAAVGAPDAVRTEIVKAFIQLRPGFQPNDALKAEIQAHVKSRLAAHEYPREIEFVDSFPTTVTGKILRRELKLRARA